VKTTSRIAKSAEKLRKAEEAVKAAKGEHRQAFRQALADLFNEYGLRLDANGCEGCDLEINEVGQFGRKIEVSELPE
jgi:hypothetical protein